MALPPAKRRKALQALGRDRLAELTDRFGLAVEDRRQSDAHVDAIVRARGLDFGELLRSLRREELQQMCAALDLDTGGREKELLVARIIGPVDEGAEYGSNREPGAAAALEVRDSAVAGMAFALTPTVKEPKRKQAARSAPRAPSGQQSGDGAVGDYRHDATRKNNPPAGLIEFDKPPPRPQREYRYDPHLDPSLQWAGKAERTSFEIDTVSLHIHERISTQAILRAVKREPIQRELFAQPDLPASKEIHFYEHDVGWSNRLVLGDSLLVMNSLLEREQMAGKVQCIYMDPPYGVKFNSNFQPSISRRDVKDGDDQSLTREPEQIQAYRDTWTLGIHSYLTYMRDRLLLARELLAETGSVFVQISDENVHHVRELMDEVFGADNFATQISFAKTSGFAATGLPTVCDYLLWYAKRKEQLRFRPLFVKRSIKTISEQFKFLERPSGEVISLTKDQIFGREEIPEGHRFAPNDLTSPGDTSESFPVTFDGRTYRANRGTHWRTTRDGIERLRAMGRLFAVGDRLAWRRFDDDFPCVQLTNHWSDTAQGGMAIDKIFVVQTVETTIARCIIMTTDPGDLVLDPTCGSGTTAVVAEQWGRRWITCDTSRVALALARQRLLTAKFPYYRLRSTRLRDGFVYKTVPHITLKSIAQNPKLDACETREQRERVIRESADQEVLYDQPEQDKGRVRVSGPFTVEAIPIAAMDAEDDAPAPLSSGARDDALPFRSSPDGSSILARGGRGERPNDVAGDYVGMMIDLLRKSPVTFAGGKSLELPNLRPVKGPFEQLHAEAEANGSAKPRRVAVSFGPRHAPVTPMQVLAGINETRGYDLALFVGFGCDPEARRIIDAGVRDRELQFVNANADILVGDGGLNLLKTSKATRLFTVFGAPDVKLHRVNGESVAVELLGIDLYDPNTGETHHAPGADVAAWFVDHDYDGRTFCISQALFPGGGAKNPWEKLSKALKGTIDEEKFETLRTTKSLPFMAGKKIAVKVIDDRGNEVIKLIDPRAAR